MSIFCIIRAEFTRLGGLRFPAVILVIQTLLLALSLLGNGSLLSEQLEAGTTTAPEASELLFGLAFAATMFASLSGAMAVTGSLRAGSFGALVIVQPSRRVLLAAQGVVAVAIGAIHALAAVAVSYAGTRIALGRAGFDVPLEATDVALLTVGLLGSCAFASVIGVAVGAAVRHQTAAVGGLVLWILAVEVPLEIAFPAIARILPGGLYTTLLGDQTAGGLPIALAALVLLGWTTGTFVAGVHRLDRQTL